MAGRVGQALVAGHQHGVQRLSQGNVSGVVGRKIVP